MLFDRINGSQIGCRLSLTQRNLASLGRADWLADMSDVIIITDWGCEPPAFAEVLSTAFSATRASVATVTAEMIAAARVIVVSSKLREADDVARLGEVIGEARRRTDTIYVALNRDRAGLVQAGALKIGLILPSFRSSQDIRVAVQKILNRGLEKGLEQRSRLVANTVEAGDALYQELGAAMRADKPLPPEVLVATARAIGEVTRREGLVAWLDAVQLHHSGTCRHMLTVAGHASSFGQYLSLHESDVAMLAEAGLLHDVGKLFIPISVLEKTGPLTEMERRAINTHSMRGASALMRGGRTAKEVIAAVRDHHEYLDGSGCPRGVGADGIGPLTRMITIADIYSALTEERSYKEAMTPRQSIAIMAGLKGKLDSRLFAAFRSMVLDPVFAKRQTSVLPGGGVRPPCLRAGIHPFDTSQETAA